MDQHGQSTDSLWKSENPTIMSDCPIPNMFNALSGGEMIKPEMSDNVVNSHQHCLTEPSCFRADLTNNSSEGQQIKIEKPDICINDFYHGLNEPSFSVKTEPTDSAVAENGLMDTIKPAIDGNSVNCWQTDQSYAVKNDEWDARMENFKPDVSNLDQMVKSAQKETIGETEEPEFNDSVDGPLNQAAETSSGDGGIQNPCDVPSGSSIFPGSTTETPLKCDSCSETFEKPILLNIHKLTHSLPYFCKVCSARFSEQIILKAHQLKHASKKPPICDVCSKRYARHCGFRANRPKGKRDAKEFECVICLKKYPEDSSYARHTTEQSSSDVCSNVPALKQNDTGKEQSCCSLCPEQFSTPHDLYEHLKTHTAKKQFLCNTCGGGFTQPADLMKHIRLHTKGKAYACDTCGMKFVCFKSLQNHLRSHAKYTPPPCTVCGKRFRSELKWMLHQRTHVVDKQFSCDLCSKTFNSSHQLKTHARAHAEEKPFVCELCDKRFRFVSSLIKHKRVHVPNKK